MHTTAYNEGYEDRLSKRGIDLERWVNPYPEGSRAQSDYLDGWNCAHAEALAFLAERRRYW